VEEWRPDEAVRAAVRRELGLSDEFLWFAAGRLEAVKDYRTLLSALAQMPGPPRLVIAGSGPLEGELRRLTSELGLESRVRFLGFEPNVRRWMQVADGFVLSSRWEGLPMGLLEAGACALPAVATDVPGTREVIVDGQTGSLCVAGGALALAGAMTRMMQMPSEERNAMGERARQRITEQFSLDVVLDRWEALYASLLAASPRPRHWAATS
jgi:glycosyltransferase involved in cell wall biosynthesis